VSTNDTQTVYLLEKLYSDIRTMKNEFTAHGLLKLNLPFLCTVVSAVRTYTFILLQLQ
jgi:hypothetical protein